MILALNFKWPQMPGSKASNPLPHLKKVLPIPNRIAQDAAAQDAPDDMEFEDFLNSTEPPNPKAAVENEVAKDQATTEPAAKIPESHEHNPGLSHPVPVPIPVPTPQTGTEQETESCTAVPSTVPKQEQAEPPTEPYADSIIAEPSRSTTQTQQPPERSGQPNSMNGHHVVDIKASSVGSSL